MMELVKCEDNRSHRYGGSAMGLRHTLGKHRKTLLVTSLALAQVALCTGGLVPPDSVTDIAYSAMMFLRLAGFCFDGPRAMRLMDE